jgi:hypothetical protein
MSSYDVFGHKLKEPPQLTMARNILGLGRNASDESIKSAYRKLLARWHPDHNQGNEKEAETKSQMYISAYRMLTEEKSKVEEEFTNELQRPFLIGNRKFCLGSLYGIRVYSPSIDFAIQDPSRMLGSGKSMGNRSKKPLETIVYGVRKSIMETQTADVLETFYGSILPQKSEKLMEDAFMNRGNGGLDDLIWIKSNDLALCHFINNEFGEAARLLKNVNNMAQKNIIFMYRLGICLEAMAARPSFKETKVNQWTSLMKESISLYNSCLERLEKRREHWTETKNEEESQILPGTEPRSMLTIMMQLADAYEDFGEKMKAKKLWDRVRVIDPNCWEARDKEKRLNSIAIASSGIRKVFGFLMPAKRV